MKTFEPARDDADETARQPAPCRVPEAEYDAPRGAKASLVQLARYQRLADASPRAQQWRPAGALATNGTGLPDRLKAGIESLSGLTMDHVRVHYGSDRPSLLQAHAYAQGSEIHVAPGMERHLPHEAWHVVQQAQGRVGATGRSAGGVAINDDAALEREADTMGQKAWAQGGGLAAAWQGGQASLPPARPGVQACPVPQRMTAEAAALAREAGQPVWVRVENGWARGIIRALPPGGQVEVVLDSGALLSVPLADAHDTPPPEAPLAEQQGALATLPAGGAALAGSAPGEMSASPKARAFHGLLQALADDARRREVRRLALSLHPDKGGNAEDFMAFRTALEWLRGGVAVARRDDARAALTWGDPGVPRPLAPRAEPALPRTEPGMELSGQPFSAAEIDGLYGLPQVHGAADLARLAASHIGAKRLLACGRLRTAATLDDLIALAVLPCMPGMLAQLETLALVTSTPELCMLASSGHAFARLRAFAALPQVASLAALLEAADIPHPGLDVVALAQLPQCVTVAHLRTLGALLPGRSALEIGVIAGIGSPSFLAPGVPDIVQLCALPKTAAQIVTLSAQPGISDTASLLALVAQTTDRDTAGDTWYDIDRRWEDVKKRLEPGSPLAGVLAATSAAWNTASVLVRAFVKVRTAPASAADLQQFALATATMTATLDLIEQIEPAIGQGGQTLLDIGGRRQALAALLAEIDADMVPFHAAPATPQRIIVNAQRLLVVNAQATLAQEELLVQNELAGYAALGGLTAPLVAQAILDQQAHAANVGAVTTAAVIDAALGAVRLAGYLERRQYPNLRLDETVVAHAFWQSLTLLEKARFNAKLHGHAVTMWGVAGYPGTRQRQNGYAGAQILLPTLAGFPVAVGGEIVHDWIFPSAGHGQPASKMNVLITHALNGTPLPILGGLAHQPTVQAGRTVHSFQNTAINIVISHANVLITFYSTQ